MSNILQTLKARISLSDERDRIARRFLANGGIILTKVEAEELLALLTKCRNDEEI